MRYRTTRAQVEAALRRNPNSKGVQALRRVLHGQEPVLLSRLEKRFRKLLRDNGLSIATATTRRATRSKPTGGASEAYARGDQFRRYTWGDVFEDPRAMLRELRDLLS